jgi:hypothetical protein
LRPTAKTPAEAVQATSEKFCQYRELLASILLTRATLPHLRASGHGLTLSVMLLYYVYHFIGETNQRAYFAMNEIASHGGSRMTKLASTVSFVLVNERQLATRRGRSAT